MIHTSIVDDEMNWRELEESILSELDGYTDNKWLPERIAITKSRIRKLVSKLKNAPRPQQLLVIESDTDTQSFPVDLKFKFQVKPDVKIKSITITEVQHEQN